MSFILYCAVTLIQIFWLHSYS
uniref:Uncharacterized protein n=1 Tax=Arundo donax TaxID=35708 RepID=A0A0A8Z479_ARUDO